jgi:uncharacterized protein (DUF1919 family)
MNTLSDLSKNFSINESKYFIRSKTTIINKKNLKIKIKKKDKYEEAGIQQ